MDIDLTAACLFAGLRIMKDIFHAKRKAGNIDRSSSSSSSSSTQIGDLARRPCARDSCPGFQAWAWELETMYNWS